MDAAETAIEVAPRASASRPLARLHKRRQRNLWLSVPAIVGVIALYGFSFYGWPGKEGPGPAHGRSLQQVGFCTKPGPGQLDGSYPPELLSGAAICAGGWLLHLFGALYMFLALSIVCDEFFVPALEVIIERFQISDDVAGATFMAAGGSAPEFFTSIIGTFLAVSEVGFGTIVGSAVFNVLFVIGCCALFARELLSLTWWPLARDSIYYSITLLALVIFFLDDKIELYESVIQLLLYVGYVVIMAYNVRLSKCTRRCLRLSDHAVSPAPTGPGGAAGPGRTARRGSVIDRANAAAGVTAARATFHAHVLHMMFYETDPKGKGPHHDKDTRFSRAVKIVMERTTAGQEGAAESKGSILMRAAAASRAAEAGGGDPAADAGGVAKDSDRKEGDEEQAVTTSAAGGGRGAAAQGPSKLGSTGGTAVPSPSGGKEVDGAALMEPVKDEEEDGDDGGDGSVEDMLRWPSSTGGRLWYICAAPLTYSMAYSIPDVRLEGRRGLFMVSFFMSVVWIAIFSYFMVWWATVVGAALAIPDSVMGLTFLAAGTSVPDLLTSVLVARQGLGDMAVSSSIGSNIFDVTVGLPFPWLLFSAINGKPVVVSSSGLRFSVFLLFIMLLVVILSIMLSRWKLSKGLGLAMFCLYGVFVAISLLIEFGQFTAPF